MKIEILLLQASPQNTLWRTSKFKCTTKFEITIQFASPRKHVEANTQNVSKDFFILAPTWARCQCQCTRAMARAKCYRKKEEEKRRNLGIITIARTTVSNEGELPSIYRFPRPTPLKDQWLSLMIHVKGLSTLRSRLNLLFGRISMHEWGLLLAGRKS